MITDEIDEAKCLCEKAVEHLALAAREKSVTSRAHLIREAFGNIHLAWSAAVKALEAESIGGLAN